MRTRNLVDDDAVNRMAVGGVSLVVRGVDAESLVAAMDEVGSPFGGDGEEFDGPAVECVRAVDVPGAVVISGDACGEADAVRVFVDWVLAAGRKVKGTGTMQVRASDDAGSATVPALWRRGGVFYDDKRLTWFAQAFPHESLSDDEWIEGWVSTVLAPDRPMALHPDGGPGVCVEPAEAIGALLDANRQDPVGEHRMVLQTDDGPLVASVSGSAPRYARKATLVAPMETTRRSYEEYSDHQLDLAAICSAAVVPPQVQERLDHGKDLLAQAAIRPEFDWFHGPYREPHHSGARYQLAYKIFLPAPVMLLPAPIINHAGERLRREFGNDALQGRWLTTATFDSVLTNRAAYRNIEDKLAGLLIHEGDYEAPPEDRERLLAEAQRAVSRLTEEGNRTIDALAPLIDLANARLPGWGHQFLQAEHPFDQTLSAAVAYLVDDLLQAEQGAPINSRLDSSTPIPDGQSPPTTTT